VTSDQVSTELVAVITAVSDHVPLVLTTEGTRLPYGPLKSSHRSLQAGLRAWVEEQTGHRLAHVEQLYTFADRDRAGSSGRVISVSYLGLTRVGTAVAGWRSWYDFFPWEDRRAEAASGGAELVATHVAPALRRWTQQAAGPEREARRVRCAVTFGLDSRPWLPELALQRYELLYEAGLIPEAPGAASTVPGLRLDQDHRRILATGVARLRATIQYRPLVFELLPETFTLGQLQGVVEALAGRPVHTQNFRRLVTGQELVEDTGERDTGTGGRPARLFRFRREVLEERSLAGTKLPGVRPH
jgi:hypothetical protein